MHLTIDVEISHPEMPERVIREVTMAWLVRQFGQAKREDPELNLRWWVKNSDGTVKPTTPTRGST